MITTALKNKSPAIVSVKKHRIKLADGAQTTLHAAKYLKSQIRPKVVKFNKPTRLLDWCDKYEHSNAISGGFFIRETDQPLGELWVEGQKQQTVSFKNGWNVGRTCFHAGLDNEITIDLFGNIPEVNGDLLQAGPMLVKDGKSAIAGEADPEGFSASANEFDSDITIERHPRAAIAVDDDFLWTVACDGRSSSEAGLFLHEFAEALIDLKVKDALNLDGGSSASLIADRRLLNCPRSAEYEQYKDGRPVHTAIILG